VGAASSSSLGGRRPLPCFFAAVGAGAASPSDSGWRDRRRLLGRGRRAPRAGGASSFAAPSWDCGRRLGWGRRAPRAGAASSSAAGGRAEGPLLEDKFQGRTRKRFREGTNFRRCRRHRRLARGRGHLQPWGSGRRPSSPAAAASPLRDSASDDVIRTEPLQGFK